MILVVLYHTIRRGVQENRVQQRQTHTWSGPLLYRILTNVDRPDARVLLAALHLNWLLVHRRYTQNRSQDP